MSAHWKYDDAATAFATSEATSLTHHPKPLMFGKKKSKEQEFQEALAELRALPRPPLDFTTPEGAILCLEDAMRRQDLDAAVACKDFQIEAVLLLLQTMPDNI